jgi:hypothetical protein
MRSHAIGLGASILAFGLLASSSARAQATAGVAYDGTPTQTSTQTGNTAIASFVVPSGDNVLAPGSEGEASADLAAGTLRAYLTESALATAGGTDPLSGDLSVSAYLADTITISGPAGNVDVTLSLTVDGSFGDLGSIPVGSETEARVQTDVGGGSSVTSTSRVTFYRYNAAQADGGGVSYMPQFTTGVETPIVTPSTISSDSVAYTHTYHVTATVGTPTPVAVDLLVYVFPTRSHTTYSDFGNTARFSITLPAGYTYTSASGILLSDPNGTGLLLDGGGGGVGPSSDAGGGGPTGDGGTKVGSDGGPSGAVDGGASDGNGADANGGSSGGCAIAPTDDPPIFLAALTIATGLAIFGKRRRKKSS